mmetsp:Transcript_66488/g.177931  ORF Transcript_66488/g.177931 Transcript_66488/m.177931 type:complete len:207 (+) Transcript_66488:41-661(+)
MPIYILVGELCSMISGLKSTTQYSSMVALTTSKVESGRRVAVQATTSMQEGHMPMWNEIIQLPDPDCSTNVRVSLSIHSGQGANRRSSEHTYTVDLAMPADMENGFCEQWVGLPVRMDAIDGCMPSHLRPLVRLRIACSKRMDIVAGLQQGLRPFELTTLGQMQSGPRCLRCPFPSRAPMTLAPDSSVVGDTRPRGAACSRGFPDL